MTKTRTPQLKKEDWSIKLGQERIRKHTLFRGSRTGTSRTEGLEGLFNIFLNESIQNQKFFCLKLKSR